MLATPQSPLRTVDSQQRALQLSAASEATQNLPQVEVRSLHLPVAAAVVAASEAALLAPASGHPAAATTPTQAVRFASLPPGCSSPGMPQGVTLRSAVPSATLRASVGGGGGTSTTAAARVTSRAAVGCSSLTYAPSLQGQASSAVPPAMQASHSGPPLAPVVEMPNTSVAPPQAATAHLVGSAATPLMLARPPPAFCASGAASTPHPRPGLPAAAVFAAVAAGNPTQPSTATPAPPPLGGTAARGRGPSPLGGTGARGRGHGQAHSPIRVLGPGTSGQQPSRVVRLASGPVLSKEGGQGMEQRPPVEPVTPGAGSAAFEELGEITL